MERFVFIAVLFLVMDGLCVAQSPKKAVTTGLCSAGLFSFPCPKGYEIRKAIGLDQPFVAFEPKHKFAVFAWSPRNGVKDEELIKEVLTQSFRLLFDLDYSELQTKSSDDFWNDEKWSRFEVSKFAKASLAKSRNLGLHYQYVVLSVKGKKVVAGYVYDAAPPRPAETWFQTWSGGGFGDASDGLQSLILAITKEKKPRSAPGGPPPPAKPKTN